MPNDLKITARIEDEGLREGLQQIADEIRRVGEASKEGFDSTREAAESGMKAMQDAVAHGISGVQGSFDTLKHVAEATFAVLATGGVFKDIVDQTQAWAFEVEHLARSLGITTSAASGWAAAAREAGVDVGTIDHAMRGLGMSMGNNAAAFDKLGIAVRENGASAKDTTAAYLPLDQILQNVMKRVDESKAGMDRLEVSRAVFRRSTPEMIEQLQRLSEHLQGSAERADAFGVSIGVDGIAHAREFQTVVADMGMSLLGMEEVIATAVIPELEELDKRVIELAKSGQLHEWAEDAVAGLKLLVSEGQAVGSWLVQHRTLVEGAALAWIMYRGALLGMSVAGVVTTILNGLQGALIGVNSAVFATSAYMEGAATATEAFAYAMGEAAVAEAALTGGLTLLFGLLAGGVAYWAMNKQGVDSLRQSLDDLRDRGAESVDTLKVKFQQAAEDAAIEAQRYGENSDKAIDAWNREAEAFDKLKQAILKNVGDKKAAYLNDLDAVKDASDQKKKVEAELEQAIQSGAHLLVDQLKIEYARDVANFDAAVTKKEQDQKAFFDALNQAKDAKKTPLLDTGTLDTPDLGKDQSAKKEEEAYKQLMLLQTRELEAAKGNAAEELAIAQDYAAKVEALQGHTANQVIEQDNKIAEYKRKMADEEKKIDEASVTTEEKIEKIEYDSKKKTIDEELQLGILSQSEATTMLQNALDERYQKEVEHVKELQALQRDNVVEYEKYQNQLDVLAAQHTADRLEIENREFKAFAANVKSVVDTIGGDFEQVLQGMLQGTQTWQQAEQHLWQSLAASAAHVVEQMVAKWVAGEAAKVLANTTGNQAMLASDNSTLTQKLIRYLLDQTGFTAQETKKTTTKVTADNTKLASQVETDQMCVVSTEASNAEIELLNATTAKKSLSASAASAAGKAYDALAGIYIVGPILGALAAAATYAAVMAFGSDISAEGGADIPSGESPVAQLHPKEMVLPAYIADNIRNMITHPDSAKGMLDAAKARGLHDTKDGQIEQLFGGDLVLPKEIASAVRAMASGASGGEARTADGVSFKAEKGAQIPHEGATQLHGGEMVVGGAPPTPSAPAAPHGAAAAAPTGGKDDKAGLTVAAKGGAAAGAVPGGRSGAGSHAGGVQQVHLVAASTELGVHGHVTSTVKTGNDPLGVTSGGGDFPVQDTSQQTKNVTIQNQPVRVAFTAFEILASASLGEISFVTLGLGVITAFRQGGDVPEDMPAYLHAKEMVLPAEIAEGLRASFLGPEGLPAPAAPQLTRYVNLSQQFAPPEASGPAAGSTLRNFLDGEIEGGGDHYHIKVDYHAWDTSTGEQQLSKHSRLLGKLITKELRLSQRNGVKGR